MIEKIKVFLTDNEQTDAHNLIHEDCDWRVCPGYKPSLEVFWNRVTSMKDDPTILKMQRRFED
jgi:hypothetical protein